MDQRTKTILIGAGALLSVAVILGIFLFLSRNPKSKITNSRGSLNPLQQLQIINPSNLPATGTTVTPSSSTTDKTFIFEGLSMKYPSNWGMLICGNSQNFEFDPEGSSDLRGIVCDNAVKPITVLVGQKVNCLGDSINLGQNQVIKSKETLDGDINYRWCLSVGNTFLDITHRVSQTGVRASSKTDYSAQVEELIKTIQKIPSGS